MVPDMRAAWCDIDLAALRDNADALSELAGVPLLPMVKANAYGHGLGPVTMELADHPLVWGMGVAFVSEAVRLRELGYRGRILVLGGTHPDEAEEALDCSATLALSTTAMAEALSRAATHREMSGSVHLKVDVGMHRLGTPFARAEEVAAEIERLPNLHLEGLLTHFAAAHDGDAASQDRTGEELTRFMELAERLNARYGPLLTHAANSSALMTRAEARMDLARPGLALYGWKPAAWLPDAPTLKPVAAVRARVVLVKEAGAEARVGYSQTPIPAGSRVGILPIGYGDGLPQAWGLHPGRVVFHSGTAPLVGSVSMDSCAVDLTGLSAEEEGSTALLVGSGPEGQVSPTEIAAATGRTSYEILTGMMRRLPRRYHGSKR
jgi:alanine racemase